MIQHFNIKDLSEAIVGFTNFRDITLKESFTSLNVARKSAESKAMDINRDLVFYLREKIVYLDEIVLLNNLVSTDRLNKEKISNIRILITAYAEPIGDNSGIYEGIINLKYNDNLSKLIEDYISKKIDSKEIKKC